MRRPLLVLTVLYVAAVLAATLTPAGFPTLVFNALFRRGVAATGTSSGPRVDDADFVANILMFAPIGLLLVLLLHRVVVAVSVAVLLTVFIEIVQLGIPSRIADVNDVLLNSGGALLGVVAGVLLLRSGSAGTRRSRAARAESARASP